MIRIGNDSVSSVLAVGEMERDAIITHGATKFLQERLTSDAYETVYCKKCGIIAISDTLAKNYSCRRCKGLATKDSFGRITIPYSMKLLMHYLNGMGFHMKFKLATPEQFAALKSGELKESDIWPSVVVSRGELQENELNEIEAIEREEDEPEEEAEEEAEHGIDDDY